MCNCENEIANHIMACLHMLWHNLTQKAIIKQLIPFHIIYTEDMPIPFGAILKAWFMCLFLSKHLAC